MTARQRHNMEMSGISPPTAVAAAIAELAAAHDYARNAQSDPWQFAVEIARLREIGLTGSDLRWLIEKGYATHAREVTRATDRVRRFVAGTNTAFSSSTRFMLTDSGLRLAGSSRDIPVLIRFPDQAADVKTATEARPHWDSERGVLCYGEQVVKRFGRASRNQEIVLATFEEDGWPQQIDDPLPPSGAVDPKRRLHDTIKWLNRNHEARLICFSGDGTGEGVRWKALQSDVLRIAPAKAKYLRPAA